MAIVSINAVMSQIMAVHGGHLKTENKDLADKALRGRKAAQRRELAHMLR